MSPVALRLPSPRRNKKPRIVTTRSDAGLQSRRVPAEPIEVRALYLAIHRERETCPV